MQIIFILQSVAIAIFLSACDTSQAPAPDDTQAEAVSNKPLSVTTNSSESKPASVCSLVPPPTVDGKAQLIISEVVGKSDTPDYLDGNAWLELHNTGAESVCLSWFHLQAAGGKAAQLPELELKSNDYIVIRAAAEASARPGRAVAIDFPKAGALKLLHGDTIIDELSWTRDETKRGRSVGRLNGEPKALYPTPGAANVPYLLFSDAQVFKVKIRLREKYYQQLMRNPVAENWYPADLEFNGAQIKNVAVSTKGSSSLRTVAALQSFHRSFGRHSFKIDFNKYQEQKFMGMKRLVFNSGFGDPSLMRDAIAFHLMRSVGMPASRLGYVDLWLEDRHLGLYQMVEPVDGEYVERYFPDDKTSGLKGNLYKAFTSLEWDGQPLRYFTHGRYPQLKLMTNEEIIGTDAEGQALLSFLKSINSGSADMIDTDLMTRYIAAMTLISNYDSYFANVGNYFLYEHRSINAFAMLPWDFNLALGRSIKPGKPCEDDVVLINHPTIAPLQERPMIARVLERPELRRVYHAHLAALLDTAFNPQAMRAYTSKLRQLIDPYVKADPTGFYRYDDWVKSFTEKVPAGLDGFGDAGALLPFIDARYDNVRRQLQGEISAGSIDSGPCPAPSRSAPGISSGSSR